ncbi:MAG: hypothetical protein DRR00_25745 [Candidatus Parabeggiatoa sp. nov. 3]|nr:MAG: hypothetical protein DRR00_25745 [Gammaproteobacteria bacterium]RKZ60326.1 MAG: hypothetical protein DRQ99_22245 [Gammaproteobacteria bacterium]HEW98145.1 hypothetical protein [Beggiatoa sp.]
MPEMGKYSKAYLAKRFHEFPAWKPNLQNLRQDKTNENGADEQRTALNDDDVLYLQENYVVTDGIIKDENIVFDDVNDEWKAFCEKVLEFDPLAYLVEDSSHLTMH